MTVGAVECEHVRVRWWFVRAGSEGLRFDVADRKQTNACWSWPPSLDATITSAPDRSPPTLPCGWDQLGEALRSVRTVAATAQRTS